MYRFNIIIFLILSTLLMLSCASRLHTIRTNDLNSFNKLNVQKSSFDTIYVGLINRLDIPVISIRYKKTFEWINSNKNGWRKMPKNYASFDYISPNITLGNDKFILSIYSDFVFMTIMDNKGNKDTFSKKILKDDFKFLNEGN